MTRGPDRRHGRLTYGERGVLVAFVAVGFVAVIMGGRASESLPQLVRGDDALAVAFGGAREVISKVAVEKANDYLHGGVELDCHRLCDHHGHEDVGCSEVEGCHDAGPAEHLFADDPWRWINERIRAPEVDRHIADEQSVELMPWFWAAVKADPHNAEAWSTAWYIAYYSLKDRGLARRVVEEAILKNPDSVEIAFTEGRDWYDSGRGDLVRARAAFLRARELGDAKCGGDVGKLSKHEGESYRFAGNYLRAIEEMHR